MKAFFSIFKKQEIKKTIKIIVGRFPVPICISIAVTLLFFILIASNESSEMINIIMRSILTGIVAFFLSTGVTLLGESLKAAVLRTYISQIIVLLFGVFFYNFIQTFSFENIVFFVLTLFGIISSLFIAPYIKYLQNMSFNEQSYYVYFYRITVVFFLSCIVGGALAALGNIAILTVQTLFDLNYSFSGDMHGYWTIFALAFLTPCFALSQIPSKGNFEDTYFNENTFFNFLMRYIAIPFIYIYFFILYAYTLKVLMNFSDWPKGEVSWMVIGFSLFGYIAYMFSYIFECGKKAESHKLISIFRKYFPYVVFPQIGMLFYAIFLRIGQYDLTVNRYFLVIFGLWLLVISLYLILSKTKSLLIIPTFLTLFTLIISIGPWSVYDFPLNRQTQRLEKNLINAGILKHGNITALEKYSDIDRKLSNEVYKGIEYVCQYNECNNIKEIFPKFYSEIYEKDKKEYEARIQDTNYLKPNDESEKYKGPSNWEIQSYISEAIKVRASYNQGRGEDQVYNIYSNDSYFPLEVSGYDYVLEVNAYNSNNGLMSAKTNNKSLELTIINGTQQEATSISTIFDSLRESYNKNNDSNMSVHNNIFEVETDSYNGRFIVEVANIFSDPEHKPEENSYEKQYINGILLLKEK